MEQSGYLITRQDGTTHTPLMIIAKSGSYAIKKYCGAKGYSYQKLPIKILDNGKPVDRFVFEGEA